MKHVIVDRRPGVYVCFPDVRQLPQTGEVFVRYGTRVRASHIDMTGGQAIARSRDEGCTWEAAVEWPPAPFMWTADGAEAVYASVVSWREVGAQQAEALRAQGVHVRAVRQGVFAYALGARVHRSSDGRNWSESDIRVPPLKQLNGFTLCNSCIRTRQGVLLTAVFGRERTPDEPYSTFVLRSDDDGRSWTFHRMAGHVGAKGFNETALTEAADGRVLAMMRTRPVSKDETFHQTESADGGLTWSAPVDTGIWGHPASLLQLPDGRLLLTYGYREQPGMGVRAVLSYDGGRTWDMVNTMVIRDDAQGRGSDNGYPTTVLMPSGGLLSIYYITDGENVTHVAATRWQL